MIMSVQGIDDVSPSMRSSPNPLYPPPNYVLFFVINRFYFVISFFFDYILKM